MFAGTFSDIAMSISKRLGGPYVSGTVVDQAGQQWDDGGSIIDPGNATLRTCMLQVDVVTDAMRQAEGYTDKDMRLLVLANTLQGRIDTDATIEVIDGPGFGVWSVASVVRDPLGIYWDCRGRLVTGKINRVFAGTIAGVSSLTGSLVGVFTMAGTMAATASLSGTIVAQAALDGAIAGQSVLAGGLAGSARFGGSVAAQGAITGGLAFTAPEVFLGASLLGFWDAERNAMITQSGGLVSSWTDVVGGYAAVQATAGSKPTVSATGFNGRQAVALDGIDDFLELIGVPFPTGASPCEIWALVDQTALPADTTLRFIFSYGGAATATTRTIGRTVTSGVNRVYILSGDGSAAPSTTATPAFDGRHVARGIITATTFNAAIDDTLGDVPRASVSATGTERVRIGAISRTTAVNFYQGLVNAILVTAPLTTPQAAQLMAYLKKRGGIA
jgi:hypothetical protein